jgi:uncharacterized damage-inducible protein DinB|tara:strand:- start:1569 stop:2066 length:498 start_codon:yes stop_codon:yes gene_type:complete
MTNREFFLQCRSLDVPRFVRVFNAVSADQLDWRPEPKARTARELIGHLIGHEQDVVELLGSGQIHHRMHVAFDDVAQAVELYEQTCRDVETALAAMTDAAWDDVPAKFWFEGAVIMEMPRRDMGWLMWFDCIHHRGQLSTYLRPMGGRVPGIYGPSADDQGTLHD